MSGTSMAAPHVAGVVALMEAVAPALTPDQHEQALAGSATDLGATFWGRTLTATDPDWAIEDAEQPGIVAGVYKNEKPPMGLEVIGDAIGLPVLANGDRSIAVKVL